MLEHLPDPSTKVSTKGAPSVASFVEAAEGRILLGMCLASAQALHYWAVWLCVKRSIIEHEALRL